MLDNIIENDYYLDYGVTFSFISLSELILINIRSIPDLHSQTHNEVTRNIEFFYDLYRNNFPAFFALYLYYFLQF